MAGAEEAKGLTHMSDIKPAIAILKEFINQRALAVDLLRVMQTLEDAPAEAARATKRVAALRKEMADLEDDKDKLLATVETIKADAKLEIAKAKEQHEAEMAKMQQAQVQAEQAMSDVRAQRREEMKAEEERFRHVIDQLQANILRAKRDDEQPIEPVRRRKSSAKSPPVSVT